MSNLFQDLKYALRTLAKSRGFALGAIAVLALGIGANSAIFSMVNRVLLRPMPYANSDRLVQIFHVPPAKSFPGTTRFSVSPGNYLDWRASGKSFDGMAAYQNPTSTLTGINRPEIVRTSFVGGDFFRIVAMQAQLGRVFSDEDDQEGKPGVAVISYGFWQSHFGGSRDALGKQLMINSKPFTVIGVAPAKMYYPAWGLGNADMWIPLAWDARTRAIRKNHNFQVVARLKPGVALSQAQAEMDTISRQLEQVDPEANRDWGAVVSTMREDLVGNVRPVLLVLLGAVAFVLLIACANVANLITVRNLARRKEIAVRAALGAGRWRALQQLLCETVVLSLAGGIAGLGLASLAMPLLASFVSQSFKLGENVPVDGRVLWFTLAVSLATGIFAGAIPAWRGSRADLAYAIRQSSRGATSDSAARRTRGVLVAVEIAFSLILLAGAGLMVRSLWLLTGVNPGFDPRNVLTMTAPVSTQNVPEEERGRFVAARFDRVLQAVRALPGVESAGLIDDLPLQGGSIQPFVIAGSPAALFAQQPTANVRVISPGYLRAMRIALLKGRDIAESDTMGRPRAVLISESMAKRFWPESNPLGQQITLSFSPEKPCEVVGVVADVKLRGLDSADPAPTLYQAQAQMPQAQTLVVRTSGTPESMTHAITSTVQAFDPERPLRNVRTLQSILDQSVSNRRMSMLLLTAFAALALLLAAFGLYSVLSYTIRRRMREIGIRLALGASARDVLRIVAIETLWPVASGIAAGLVGAILLSTLLTKLIYGIRPTDPFTFASVALMLAIVSMLASIIPAWRATRVDPLQVLRDE